MNEASAPILIFGGSFDPPHHAHIELPLRAADAINAERVLFIPTRVNPQKTDHPPTDSSHRLAMLHGAIAHDSRAQISTIELEREPPNYSIDTVKALRRTLGADAPPMRLLIGADQALNFTSWRQWQELVQLAEPLVMPRPPHTLHTLPAEYEEVFPGDSAVWLARTLELPSEEVSSTNVREAHNPDVELEALVPKSVAAYIRSHRLYGFGPERDTIG